jgi:hypothetical protein
VCRAKGGGGLLHRGLPGSSAALHRAQITLCIVRNDAGGQAESDCSRQLLAGCAHSSSWQPGIVREAGYVPSKPPITRRRTLLNSSPLSPSCRVRSLSPAAAAPLLSPCSALRLRTTAADPRLG